MSDCEGLNILIIGESCRDVYQYGNCSRLCPEAPVPVFKTGFDTKINGGMARNVHNNVLSLGISADLYTNQNWETINKIRYVDYRTNYIIVRIDQNDDLYGKADLKDIDFKKYDAVIISDYNKGFLTHEDIQLIAEQHPVTFLDSKKILGKWIENIKYVKINDLEFDRTKHKIPKRLMNKFIITLGPDGCKHKNKNYPVPKVEIKDASGAGDTFIAALAVEYVKSQKIEKAILFANECATSVVQKKGVSTA
tara:strand:+ start:712 stop:1464 length:753 start_codon:yes stop_codon:yes gene_type:complete